MNIKQYINSLTKKERLKAKKLWAKELHVTIGAVTHWANGTRQPNPLRLKKLEKLTKGKIKRQHVRPDYYE